MTNLTNITGGYLFQYNKSAQIYVCPSETAKTDPSIASPVGAPRILSYSMDYNLGSTNPSYAAYNILYDRNMPPNVGPSRHSVFWHEDARSIDNGAFGIWPWGNNSWWNIPTSLHDRGCCLSFFDGHVEYWKWVGTAVLASGIPANGYFVNYPAVTVSPSNPADVTDLHSAKTSCIPGAP